MSGVTTTAVLIERLRAVFFRAAPLSPEEREAFITFSGHLKRQLDAAEEELLLAGRSTDSIQAARYLLEALPGITV